MAVDDGSFKKQGTIPFKWEIRPGVPKVQAQQPEQQPIQQHVLDCKILHKEQLKKKNPNKAFPETPSKLAPPPARFQYQPQMEPRTRSFLSAPRALSERYSFYTSALARSTNVYPVGCLPSSPLLRKTDNKKKMYKHKLKVQPQSEPERSSDLEMLSQWSLSSRRSRKSSPPFRDSSPSSSSFSSHRSSPLPMNDAEWAGFGLF